MKNKRFINIVKVLYKRFISDEITALGAQVTYYLILSFFPFLIFIVSVISYTNIVSTDSLVLISSLLPASVYKLIEDLIRYVLATRNSALISIGMIATVWSGSVGILAFMYGMNKAFKKKETRPFWKIRLLSILFTFVFALIILFSILLLVFGEILGKQLFLIVGISKSLDIVWDLLRYFIALASFFLVFMLFYIYIPNCNLRVRDVIPGTLLATLGWLALSLGFSFYVNRFGSFSKIYGSIGAVIALLIWLYWSSIIVFVGSELNAILAEKNNCVNSA